MGDVVVSSWTGMKPVEPDWKHIATEVAFALGNGYRPELEEDELAALTEAVRQYQSER